jgi:hypothetical protein
MVLIPSSSGQDFKDLVAKKLFKTTPCNGSCQDFRCLKSYLFCHGATMLLFCKKPAAKKSKLD